MGEGLGSFEYHFEHHVEPHHVERFLRLSNRMQQLARRHKGFLNVERRLIEERPNASVFRTSMRFNTIQQCMSWLDDPERRRLLVQEEEETGYRFSGRANWMGYGRWLSRRIKRPVATWKVNLLVLLSLYPTAMLVAPLLQRLLPDASRASLMLLSNAACVAATSWLLVPAMSRAYRPWLEGETSPQQTWRWLASLLLWITLLWWGFSSLSPPQVTLKL
jgi:antibiotic biosynthesis monooxygenase (ABM) superfamily enzyme